MMPRIRGVELKEAGVRELLLSAMVRANLEGRMEQALAMAKAQAPVDTGAYRESLSLETVETDRVGVRLLASVPYAWAVEADTGNLLRALDQARK